MASSYPILVYQLLLDSEVVCRANHLMDIPHGLWCQSFRLLFRFDAVYPPSSKCL